MKNNGPSYAERKRISLKIERNNSMNSNQNNKAKKESNVNNKIIHKIKIKRLSSYKEPPISTNQHHKENINDKEKFKDSFLFKKISLNNETLRNKPSKIIKNNNSIGPLKQIDLNINLNNNNHKVYNSKSSIDSDDKAKKFKQAMINHMNESNYNEIRLNNKTSMISKKKKIMNNSYCSSNKDINKIINNSNNNFISITSKSSRKNNEDILYIQDEILELKLINSRANNEIIILKEKNNSLRELIDMKEKEMQLIKNKYLKMIDEANDEQIKIKNKLENEYKSLQKNYDISIRSIKSLLETVIELTETIIYNEKSHNNNFYNNFNSKNITNNFNQISFSGAADCSLDMYESNINLENNNREEDKDNKRNILLEQIKEIIIEKINNITHKLNLVLDSSFLEKIERLNNWNFHNFNVKYSPNYSFNLYNLQKRNNINQNTTCNLNDELFSGSLSKYNMSLNNEVSNDFDFSVSKSFYNPSSNISASPKFNRSIKVENNHINTNDNGNVKSLLFSFDEASKNNIVKNKNILNNTGNNNLNGNNHIFNILEYSMVDLVNSGEYASSNIHNIININNTVNNNNFTESKDNNFKGFYESFSNSNSKNKFSSKDRIKNENNNIKINNNNLFIDSVNENIGEIKKRDKENSDIGNITLKDIEQ
jgi:hypothetical protein